MGLSCSCDYEYEFEPGEWTYFFPAMVDFVPLDTKKAKRCCSCKRLIKVGDICSKYPRYRYPYTEVEAKIKCRRDLDDCFSDEPCIRIVDHCHCEWCGEIYLNLVDLGYECLLPNESMKDILAEYHDISGFVQQEVK